MQPIVQNIRSLNLLFARRYLVEWSNQGLTDLSAFDGFNIYRSQTFFDGFTKIISVPNTQLQYVDQVPGTFGVNWFYKVTAYKTSPADESDLASTEAASDTTLDQFEDRPFLLNVTRESFVSGETPVGVIDGSNLLFQTLNAYTPLSIAVYVNGVRKSRAIDYTELTANTFQFISTKQPAGGQVLRTDYVKR